MANSENLKKGVATQFRAGEEQAEIARKGGIASGEARRAKKTLCARVKMVGELISGEKAKRQMMGIGISEEDCDLYTQAAVSLFQKAMKGDVSAFNAIRDIIGEKPVDKTQLSGGFDTNITIGFVETGIEPVSSEEDVDI